METKELNAKDLEAVTGGVKLENTKIDKKSLKKDDSEPAIKPVMPKVLETEKVPKPTPLDPNPKTPEETIRHPIPSLPSRPVRGGIFSRRFPTAFSGPCAKPLDKPGRGML